MFGNLDVVANEWTEGIFAQLWRKANKDKKNFTWLVLDGPVDAIWIENMNTVMDDNKILTLANNDRIPMLRPNVTLHFEVEDLRNASPATVSRAGIIYVSLNDLGWQPMATSWSRRAKDGERDQGASPDGRRRQSSGDLLDLHRPRVPTPCMYVHAEMGALASLVTLLTALLDGTGKEGHALDEHLERALHLRAHLDGRRRILENDDRARVDKQAARDHQAACPSSVRQEARHRVRVQASTTASGRVGALGAPRARVGASTRRRGRRATSSPRSSCPRSTRCATSTRSSLASASGARCCSSAARAPPRRRRCCRCLDKQDPADDATMFKKMSFSSATTPAIFQATMEASVEKRQGKTFGPPGKKMLVFVDDISMPAVNEWGDQITLEIVRQLMEAGGLVQPRQAGRVQVHQGRAHARRDAAPRAAARTTSPTAPSATST